MPATILDDRAKALLEAGDVDALDDHLAARVAAARDEDRATRALGDVQGLVAVGQRESAVRLARAVVARFPELADVARVAREVDASRVRGPRFVLRVDQQRMAVVVSAGPIVLGRSGAELEIPSPLVSRRHLRFARDRDVLAVSDLGSQNGTTLRGLALSGMVTVPRGGSISLRLGGEVTLDVAYDDDGVRLVSSAGEQRWTDRVGPFRLAPGGRLSASAGGPSPVLGEDVEVPEGIDLCHGDVVRTERRGPVVVAVE